MRALLALLFAVSGAAAQTLDPPVVPAGGEQVVRLKIPSAGRYSISVKSPHGMALRLEDRLVGSMGQAGVAGREDGRLDLLLDEGDYRVRLSGPAKGAGEGTVTVVPFADTGPADEVLEDTATLTGTLADRQSRGAWIQVTERGPVLVEAAGRALVDLRLWKDGQWLVDALPRCEVLAARPGEPRNHCSLWPSVEPGWYRLVAYGGTGQAWPQPSAEADAVFLRRGLTELATAGARRVVVGPLGIERFRVRGGLHRVRWVQPEITPAQLRAGGFNPAAPFAPPPMASPITAQSRAPEAEISGMFGDCVITVSAAPGQVGTLRWLRTDPMRLAEPGAWFAMVVHTAGPDDLPPSAQWVVTADGGESAGPGGLPDLTSAGIVHAFNLQGESELFLNVATPGTYPIALEGGRVRVEPWWLRPPGNYQSPPLQPAITLPLAAGPYRVTLSPDQPGQVKLRVQGAGEPPITPIPLRWDRLDVPEKTTFSLYMARQPGVAAALVARKLPVDLTGGLPLRLAPAETLLLPIQPAPGVVVATDQDGRRLPVGLAGQLLREHVAAPKGGPLVIRNDRDQWTLVELRAVPLTAVGSPPRLTPAQKAELPDFPVISVGASAGLDLATGATATWKLRVETPALYVAESSGLLATQGTLRTRTRVNIVRDQGSGTGRNFAVARYLKPAEYQLTVGALGASAGHLGLQLRRTERVEAGPLAPGRTARLRLPAGQAAVYSLEVPVSPPESPKARFRIHSTGPGRALGCRLEDAEGYPVAEGPCNHTRPLDPGTYQLLLLPERVETIRLTTLTALDTAVKREGAGPHVLPFDEEVVHTWQEPEASSERAPHVWTFSLQGPTPVSLSLSAAVTGELKGPFALRLPPGRTWTGPLPKGDYRLEVVAVHADDGAEYALELEPHWLVAGAQRSTNSYDEVRFSVGESGLYTLSTAGDVDVRLKVKDPISGRVLAEADDGPDDWNARLSVHLAAGEYLADLDAPHYDSTVLSLRHEVPEGATAPVPERTLPPGGLVVPWTGGPVALARVEAAEHVAIAFEVADGDGWRVLAEDQGRTPRVAIRPGEGAHRVRVWSLEDAGRPVRLTLEALTPGPVAEADLGRGIEAKGAISLKFSAGVLDLSAVPAGALVCPAAGAGCHALTPGAHAADGPVVIAEGRLQGRRLRLESTATLTVAGPTPLDLAPGRGPRFIEAAAPAGRPSLSLASEPTGEGARGVAVLDLPGVATTLGLGTDGTPLTVHLRARPLTVLPEITPSAQWTGELPPNSLQMLKLSGEHRLRVVLGRGAALRTAEHLRWADDSPTVEDVPRVAGLMLVNPTDAPVPCRVDLGPPAAEPEVLKPLKPFEFLPARAGTLHLPVAAAEGTLRVLGAAGHYRRTDGRWLPAEGAAVGGGGELHLRHGRDAVVVWIEAPNQAGPWPFAGGLATPVGGAMSLPLEGPRRLQIALAGPAMVSLHGPRDAVLQARATDGVAQTALDGRLDLWLPAGTGEVEVRGLGGATPRGALEIDVLVPAEAGEGLGAPALLAPGDTHLVRFTTTRPGQVGLGARAEVDRLQATLMDTRGQVVARGGTLMPELAAGTWLLALHLPEDAPPTVARPSLVGIAPPPDTPPPEVAVAYREGRSVEPEVPEDATWRPWIWEGDVPEEPEVPDYTDDSEYVPDEPEESDGPANTRMGTDDTETDAAPAPGDEPEDAGVEEPEDGEDGEDTENTEESEE